MAHDDQGGIWVTGLHGTVGPALGGPATEQWAALHNKHRAKLENRFRLLCTADSPLDYTKIRLVKGGPEGIYEIKVSNPPYRAFAFLERGSTWRVTHIDLKPAKSRVIEEARRAARIRSDHQKRIREDGQNTAER